jgi:hypothetical protein
MSRTNSAAPLICLISWNTANLLLSTPLKHPQLTQALQDVKTLRDTEALRDLGEEADGRRLNINEFRSPKTESTIGNAWDRDGQVRNVRICGEMEHMVIESVRRLDIESYTISLLS